MGWMVKRLPIVKDIRQSALSSLMLGFLSVICWNSSAKFLPLMSPPAFGSRLLVLMLVDGDARFLQYLQYADVGHALCSAAA